MNQQNPDSNKEQNREKGKVAEQLAIDILTSKGYKIVKQNFHFGTLGEIDIIAKDNDILVFVEVKSSFSQEFGVAVLKVDKRKQAQIKKIANGYIYINKITDVQSRFDVITIDKLNGKIVTEHYINAFY